MSDFDWRSASDADVDHQYSPSQHALRPLDDYLVEYATLSAPYRSATLCHPHDPLVVYIHGGYWQRLSAADSLFNASDALAHGISLHAVDYTLAPEATVMQMVNECIADILSVLNALQPTRVVIAGCSAGAHLAAMSVRHSSLRERVDGVALLSGIYDVRPIVRTPTNEPLGLTEASATEVSPLLLPQVSPPARALLAVGRSESSEFIRQNREYGELLSRQGAEVATHVVEERDHFNLPYDLLREGTIVGDWVLARLKGHAS